MRYRIENSKSGFTLINNILRSELPTDEHIRTHGLPVLPSVGDEIQSYRKFYRVVRRIFLTQDGNSVELYVEPSDPEEAAHHRKVAQG